MQSALECLQDLENISQLKDSDSRRQLLHKVTDLFFVTELDQSISDKDVFADVMERLASQVEEEARAELSQRLAFAESAPHKIVVNLANDTINVAQPVLEHSRVLTDNDLVNIASRHSQDHLMAMCIREELSPMVTDAIVAHGQDPVLNRVVQNKGAHFSTGGYKNLAARAVNNEELRTSLEERNDTPPALVEAIKQRVSAKLKAEMAETHPEVSEIEIESVVDSKAAKVSDTTEITSYEPDTELPTEDIAYLHRCGELTEFRVMKFARESRVPEVVHSIALLSKIEPDMVQHCLFESEIPALSVLCRANDFSRNTFGSLLQLRVEADQLPTNMVLSAMKRYDMLQKETAERIMRFLKVRLSAAVK